MKIKVHKIASILLLFGLAQGVFTSAFADQNSPGTNANFVPPASVKIIVSEAAATSAITAFSASNLSLQNFSCAGGQSLEKTLIQDQASLNLNQPADCFSLSPAELIQNQTRLSVKPLAGFQQRIVVLPNARIMSNYYQSSSNTFPQSAGNVIFPAGLAVFAISAFGIIKAKQRKLSFSHIKQSLSLAQLQLMRC